MQPVLTISSFIFLITVILCFVTGSVLLVFSRSKSVNNRWLAGYYLVIGYGFLVAFLLYSGLITVFPWYHTYRTGYIPGFLFMPFSFFYVRSLIQQKRFRPADLIHFIPVIIFIIDFIPFYSRSGSYKLQQAAIDAVRLNTTWSQFSQGWLSIGFIYTPLRILLTMVYWILQVRMIFHLSKVKGDNLIAENRGVMTWAKIFCASQVLFFLPYYLNAVIGNQQNFFFVSVTSTAIGIGITTIALIMQPNILYGLKGVMIRNVKIDPGNYDDYPAASSAEKITGDPGHLKFRLVSIESQTNENNANTEVYLSGQNLTNLGKEVTGHILQQRSYLKKGCTCAALAAEMNVQPYILSAVINQVFKTNFNDFLNGHRIDHAKTLIQNGQAKMLTLEGLSEQCGFNNRNSFTTAFKKHTGQTPSDFIKQGTGFNDLNAAELPN
ncbi:MAG TPA: helix-turn-helix transcriptional regulator [Parafilimonas sp.]|nr:helix-turn-helix transcriptional regulator [Parafilimonas sp.]